MPFQTQDARDKRDLRRRVTAITIFATISMRTRFHSGALILELMSKKGRSLHELLEPLRAAISFQGR